jgi:thioredoxin 1
MVEKNHEELVGMLKSGKKILLDVYGTFCSPCKTLLPKLELIEGEYPEIMFIKMDISKNMLFAQEMEISSVPTVIIYNGETIVNRSKGIQSDTFYKEILTSL